VLATVKGDVHDIGKNLVDIILSNNGYTVYNLGIKQPIATSSRRGARHKADAIGLSGLLVKSVNVMEENLKELNEQGIDGSGAAGRRGADAALLRGVPAPPTTGQVLYGKDAFEGCGSWTTS
jgi:5-methyltetrahydrofolate--homocysteine methyltransferase